MADPTPFVPGYSYTDYQETAPNDPLPGPQVDNDFADVATSTVTLVNAVKDVRRSDGKLKNGIVTYDSLSASVKALLANTPTAAIPGFLTVENFGAQGGTVDDSAAFEAAFASGQRVLLSDVRGYTVKNVPTSDSGATLYCLVKGGVTINIPNGETGFIVQGAATIDGPTIAGDSLYSIVDDPAVSTVENFTLRNARLEGGNFLVYTFGGGRMRRKWRFENVDFVGSTNCCFFEKLDDSVFDERCTWSDVAGSHMTFYNGARNEIRGTLYGGVASIIFLGMFSNAGFAYGPVEGNVIDVKLVEPLEEGVAFDINGADPDDCMARERSTVSAKSSSNPDYYAITLAGTWPAESTGAFGNANGGEGGLAAYLCMTDGAQEGASYRIFTNTLGQMLFRRRTASGVVGDMSDAAFAAINVGDAAVVGMPFRDNTVTVRGTGQAGANDYTAMVQIYGLGLCNKVIDSTIAMQKTGGSDICRGIAVFSLENINGAGSYISSSGHQRAAPSPGNLVAQNNLQGCDIEVAYYGFNADPATYLTGGNRVVNNTVADGRLIYDAQAGDGRSGNLVIS